MEATFTSYLVCLLHDSYYITMMFQLQKLYSVE
jgi:hypothetical protein